MQDRRLKPSTSNISRTLHSFKSVPSLSYASSTSSDTGDFSPRLQVLADTWDASDHIADQDYHPSRRKIQIYQSKESESSFASPPAKHTDIDSDWVEIDKKGRRSSSRTETPVWTESDKQGKKRRLRVDSNPPTALPPGFPYRNSALLMSRFLKASKASSDDSSDEVDLDLSFGVDHIGIDMSSHNLAVSSEEELARHSDWWNDVELETKIIRPVSFSSHKDRNLTRSRCRSAVDLRSKSPAQDDQGWSFNRTEPIQTPDPTHSSEESEEPSLRTKRTGRTPLSILLARPFSATKDTTSPTSTATPTTGSGWTFRRRDSKSTDLTGFTSPQFSSNDNPLTPKSVHSNYPQSSYPYQGKGRLRTESEDPDSTNTPETSNVSSDEFGTGAEFGRLTDSQIRSQFSSYHTAHPGQNSLMNTVATHFRGLPDRTMMPHSTEGMHGLGLSDLDLPSTNISAAPSTDHIPALAVIAPDQSQEAIFEPKSPASSYGTCSPRSPGSPLLDASATDEAYAIRSRSSALENTRKFDSASTGFFSRVFGGGSSSTDIPETPHISNQSSPMHHSSSWLHPITLIEDCPPAKLLFWAAFILGPFCWLLGGWFIRPDGELFGTRAGVCRCSRRQSSHNQQIFLVCPADIHRSLRLMGAQSAPDGLPAMAQQSHLDGNKVALLNADLARRDGYVLACRVMATLAGTTILVGTVVSILVVCAAF